MWPRLQRAHGRTLATRARAPLPRPRTAAATGCAQATRTRGECSAQHATWLAGVTRACARVNEPHAPAALATDARRARRPPPVPGALAEAVAYKTTRFADVVVQRRLRLLPDRVLSLHLPEPGAPPCSDGGGERKQTWPLDRQCRLEPECADDIALQQRTLRPPGTWTVTAAATARGQPIELVSAAPRWEGGTTRRPAAPLRSCAPTGGAPAWRRAARPRGPHPCHPPRCTVFRDRPLACQLACHQRL